MLEKVLSPRHILAKNLKALIKTSSWTGPEVARRAGIDRKTAWNYLNARSDPRPEHVTALAKVFGLEGYMLLSAAFRPEMANDANLKRLVEHYEQANEAGRDLILRVAEAAPRKD